MGGTVVELAVAQDVAERPRHGLLKYADSGGRPLQCGIQIPRNAVEAGVAVLGVEEVVGVLQARDVVGDGGVGVQAPGMKPAAADRHGVLVVRGLICLAGVFIRQPYPLHSPFRPSGQCGDLLLQRRQPARLLGEVGVVIGGVEPVVVRVQHPHSQRAVQFRYGLLRQCTGRLQPRKRAPQPLPCRGGVHSERHEGIVYLGSGGR